jgi:hypothetical protein
MLLTQERYTGESREPAKSNDVSEIGNWIEKYSQFFFLSFKGLIKTNTTKT